MEKDIDSFVRLAVDFDEIWDKSIKQLDLVKDELLGFKNHLNMAGHLDSVNLPIHNMPWLSNVKINNRLKQWEVMKEDLQRILARLPMYTKIHALRVKKLKDLLKYKYEVERISQMILSDHRKPIYPPALMLELPPPK